LRRTGFNEEWKFIAVDIVEALTDSKNPLDIFKIYEEAR